MQGIRAADLQLNLPICLLSCKVCSKEWEDLMKADAKVRLAGYFRQADKLPAAVINRMLGRKYKEGHSSA